MSRAGKIQPLNDRRFAVKIIRSKISKASI